MATAVIHQESFTIEIERQAHNSYKILERMQKERVLCDVPLVAKDMEIPAHKTVLASCSPYFYSMFTNFRTEKYERIPLDVNPQMLLAVINCMYTSKLVVIEENLKDLLEVSKLLLLNGVQLECCNILKRVINPNNCFHIKSVAAKYEQSDLLTSTSSYIDDNFVDAVASEEFLNLTSDEISELISKDTLNVYSEEKVYESIVRWINQDSKGRRKYLRLLMGHIRLGFISKNYLRQHIVEDQFLRGDTYCKDLIIKALLEHDGTAIPKTKPRRYARNEKVLLVIGGCTKNSRNSLEYYNFEKKSWSKVLKMPFNVRLAGLAVVNQKVYIIGGERNDETARAANCYDINTNKWEKINDMMMERQQHAVAVLNNCIYAIGGTNNRGTLHSTVKFDFQTQKWSYVARMLQKRRLLGTCVLDGLLYAVGGCSDSDLLNSVESYNHHTNTWKQLSSMNDRREGAGVCALDGKLYAIGGHDGEQLLSTVEEYNPITDSWTIKSPMKVPRGFIGVAVAYNKIYVTGGCDDNSLVNSVVEVYDKFTNSWTFLPKSMNIGRWYHGAVIVNKTT